MGRYLAAGVVRVLAQLGVHGLQEHGVGDLAPGQAGLIQDGDDALVRLLHQVHDDLVVEVLDLGGGRAEVTGHGPGGALGLNPTLGVVTAWPRVPQ